MKGQKWLRGAGVTEINMSRDGREGEDEMAVASSVKVGGSLSLFLILISEQGRGHKCVSCGDCVFAQSSIFLHLPA